MTLPLARFHQLFVDEAEALLQELPVILQQIEAAPDDPALLSHLLLSVNTVRGTSTMFHVPGFTYFAHVLESLLEHLVRGNLLLTQELLALLRRAVQILQELVGTVHECTGTPKAWEQVQRELEHALVQCVLAGPTLPPAELFVPLPRQHEKSLRTRVS